MRRLSMSISWFLILLLGISITASCQEIPSATNATTPTPTGVLISDREFKNSSESWCEKGTYEFGDFYCQDGELHLVAKGEGNIATLYDGDFKNFILLTQMRSIGNTGVYGVVFRGKHSPPTFYIFQLNLAGQYQLIKWSQTQDQNDILIPWTTSDAIKKDQATNELKVLAQESQITLYVNNQQLASIADKSLTNGVAGPVAAEQGHVAVSFVKVWELP
jgi:hypothetical protein